MTTREGLIVHLLQCGSQLREEEEDEERELSCGDSVCVCVCVRAADLFIASAG